MNGFLPSTYLLNVPSPGLVIKNRTVSTSILVICSDRKTSSFLHGIQKSALSIINLDFSLTFLFYCLNVFLTRLEDLYHSTVMCFNHSPLIIYLHKTDVIERKFKKRKKRKEERRMMLITMCCQCKGSLIRKDFYLLIHHNFHYLFQRTVEDCKSI